MLLSTFPSKQFDLSCIYSTKQFLSHGMCFIIMEVPSLVFHSWYGSCLGYLQLAFYINSNSFYLFSLPNSVRPPISLDTHMHLAPSQWSHRGQMNCFSIIRRFIIYWKILRSELFIRWGNEHKYQIQVHNIAEGQKPVTSHRLNE